MCAKFKQFSFSEIFSLAAFIAAQCVWGFCLGFSEFGIETFLAARVRFASRAISRKFCLNLLCPKQKEFLRHFSVVI